ncbi:S-layer homology domain-containing protein [Falsibacillus albus]|uniref:S-layer protein n=1 Tax=Falsibacillus albus TaxID=2478915 RepID=A0A3L7K487_9BACI|nr:S-layer homology domain-containing protein [Falsibacillus albus]RLQ96831.1 S-layer protein [Falsibacillus albus]
MKKPFLLIMAALLVIMGGFQGKSAYAASDDITGITLEKEMRDMIAQGVIQGYSEGVYKPKNDVTRGEFATFISRALKLPDANSLTNFPDVAPDSKLAAGINSAAAAGLITGYGDKTFRPNDKITREQMANMIAGAMDYLALDQTPAALNFADLNEFPSSISRASVMVCVGSEIINGIQNSDGSFSFQPKKYAQRDQAAAMLSRMLNVAKQQEEEEQPPTDTYSFKIATIDNGELKYSSRTYASMDSAASAITSPNTQVVTQGTGENNIVKMKSGIAVAKATTDSATTILYDENLSKQLTYVVPQTEMKYLDADGEKVKVQVADTIGYVKQTAVTLIPDAMKKGQSYYTAENGSLVHHIYTPSADKYVSYIFGKAPAFMTPGVNYYSWDGHIFLNANGTKAGEAYQYFNYLPIRTTTTYTADQLNQYVDSVKADSPLKTQGAAFKKAEEMYHINALFLLANAIHESNFGLSSIAQDKFNLFGIRAYDGDAYNSAQTFKSFEECILYQAERLSSKYVNPNGGYDNGAVSGNKSVGLNVKYASDPYWGQKIAGYMYRADNYLKNQDPKYKLGLTNTGGLNVRQQPNTSLPAEFTYAKSGAPVVMMEESKQSDGTWIKTISDLKDYTDAYIYGEFVDEIPVAK